MDETCYAAPLRQIGTEWVPGVHCDHPEPGAQWAAYCCFCGRQRPVMHGPYLKQVPS